MRATARLTVASLIVLMGLVLAFSSVPTAQAPATPSPDAAVPGELVVEPPTLINLGFEWFLEGDANRNAAVDVAYRRQGDTAWRPALPLLRMGGERIYAESRVDVVVPSMFAGSLPMERGMRSTATRRSLDCWRSPPDSGPSCIGSHWTRR